MMKNNVLRLLRPLYLLPGFLTCLIACSYGQEQKPEEVDVDDARWKKTDNLTIKSENVTKRMEELEHSQDSDRFVYFRATDNNKENFRATCKFIPVVHQETNAEVEAKLIWKMEDDQGQVRPEEQELAWEYPYEADLQHVSPENDCRILVCMQARLKYPEEKKETKIVRGQKRSVFIHDPKLNMMVTSITFNTNPGKVDNDAFDVVDKVKGKVINNIPEFKDGNPVNKNMIVVYPVKSKPVVKAELQLASQKLPASKLQKYQWGARAEAFERDDNNIMDKLGLQGEMGKSIKNGKLVLTGNFAVEEPLGPEMCKGKIDLEWLLQWDGEDITLKKRHRATMDPAYLILRQEEIDQNAKKDTKLWKEGLEVAVNKILGGGAQNVPQKCSDPQAYAKKLVCGIYQQTWYPNQFLPAYSRRIMNGNVYAYDIFLNKMVKEFSKGEINIICVEAAALFRSMQNMVTDGEAQATDIMRKKDWGHQIAMWKGKVYDGTPRKKNGDAEREPQESYKAGTCTLDQYIEEKNKRSSGDPWYILNENVEHRLLN